MSVRVYVPATLPLLRAWRDAGAVPAEVERFEAPDDTEEGEYAALEAAAEASAELATSPGHRRVVVVAEAADPDAELPWRDLAAVHADPAGSADTSSPARGDLAWYAVQEVDDLLG